MKSIRVPSVQATLCFGLCALFHLPLLGLAAYCLLNPVLLFPALTRGSGRKYLLASLGVYFVLVIGSVGLFLKSYGESGAADGYLVPFLLFWGVAVILALQLAVWAVSAILRSS